MKGFCAFLASGLLIVTLSAMPPEHARWVALALLGLIVLTPAVSRRVQPTAEEVGKPREETE